MSHYEVYGTSQCFTGYPQYPGDRVDNPIFGGRGFDMVGTAAACQTQCDDPNTIDSRGRRCVAVEHSSQDPHAVANCAFAWDCNEIRHWVGGKVYRRTEVGRITEAPSPQPSVSPSTTEPTMGPTHAPMTSKPTFAPSDAPTTYQDASIFSATSEDECIHEIFDIGRVFGKEAHTIHIKLEMPEYSDPRQWILNLGQEGTGANHWIWRDESVQFGSWNGAQIRKVDINSCTDLTTTFDGKNTLMLYCDSTFLGQIENSNLHIRNSKLAVAGNKLYEVPRGNFGGCIHHVEVWDYDLSAVQVASLTKGASIFSTASEESCIHEVFDIGRVFGEDAHTIHVELDMPEYSDPRQWILNLGQETTGANHWIWRGESIQFGSWNGAQIRKVDINSCSDLTTTFDGRHTLTLYCNGKYVGQIENANLHISNSNLAVAGNQRFEVPLGNFGGCVHHVEVWDYDLSSREVASLTKSAPTETSVDY